MKQSIPLLALALAIILSLSLAACGQRVRPADPAGKIIPSTAY